MNASGERLNSTETQHPVKMKYKKKKNCARAGVTETQSKESKIEKEKQFVLGMLLGYVR